MGDHWVSWSRVDSSDLNCSREETILYTASVRLWPEIRAYWTDTVQVRLWPATLAPSYKFLGQLLCSCDVGVHCFQRWNGRAVLMRASLYFNGFDWWFFLDYIINWARQISVGFDTIISIYPQREPPRNSKMVTYKTRGDKGRHKLFLAENRINLIIQCWNMSVKIKRFYVVNNISFQLMSHSISYEEATCNSVLDSKASW